MRTITNSSPPLCIGPRCILSTRTRCRSLSPCNNYPSRQFLYTRIYSPSTENSLSRSFIRSHNFPLPFTRAEIFMHFIKPLSVKWFDSFLISFTLTRCKFDSVYTPTVGRADHATACLFSLEYVGERMEEKGKRRRRRRKGGKKGKEPVERGRGNFAWYEVVCTREWLTVKSIFFFASGKWCPRREWSSPPDAQRAASDARRGVLYSSVFLGSPGKSLYQNFFTLLSLENPFLQTLPSNTRIES